MFRLLNSENLTLKMIADNLDTSMATIDNHYAEISNRFNEEYLLPMKNRRL
jgi:FixJ family two-component response regulator